MVSVLYANGASSGHCLVNDFFRVISNPSLLLLGLRSQQNAIFWHFARNFLSCLDEHKLWNAGVCKWVWWGLPRPFGGTVSKLLPANAGKTKPTSSASFTAVKSNQTFFLSLQCLSKFRVLQCRGVYRICAPGAEHCAQCNRVWGPRSRFRCNPTFNFSIKGKGMAPAIKLI